ncbi:MULTISPECIES: glycine cleavage system aminomethyltransferase GcvT [Cyanophyceae]|uniref:Aminomethyltransferase n=1 Tax=Picosynechococcus sp. (strain ATCC 27264 / PCC 7002 / PR-6) TaxID=32049 RepID=GCST_PICP2|nr:MULTISPECIES: glycine cleavage system aminomethyltransferase GcvT [Cyanophyceae]B1XP99.1 RecName: Full=Aminomethyltransferase; AltName: Full=Glycine cleavage system T protein [Picosynechococcus sp. PCC 7002]ACA99692.1 glycine cleavage system T protein [Picosynechococcus sp. PCC 7002]ANV90705.1 glycine cleavage system protein T [Picosynechococcus sp. PCC 8807]SMH56812.1 aminomethyltransferase [Picosynechococcus sp. OG1]SMQ83503.1 aminomethyltransferase [Synechococcus sp. 7002]
MTLQRTPLHDLAIAAGAKFVPFSGWEMAVQYKGLKVEHQAVRTEVGMFDISHMGKFQLAGENLIAAMQKLVPSNLARLAPGQAQYTVLLNDHGGIIDDVIYYHQGDRQGFLIVNAATTQKDWDWLTHHLTAQGITLTDVSQENILLAIQGPQAEKALQPVVENLDLATLKLFNHGQGQIFGETAFIARTGYTGEDGFEVMVAPTAGKKLWSALIDAGVMPCGLGARDTLRLEAGLHLYGQDMDDDTTPLEAGLGWLIHWQEKDAFIAKDILQTQKAAGVQRRLVGLEMQGRGIARHDYSVLVNGEAVGLVTSGTMSPTLEKAIALAYLPLEFSKVGQAVTVEIRGKQYPAQVVKKPFYRASKK